MSAGLNGFRRMGRLDDVSIDQLVGPSSFVDSAEALVSRDRGLPLAWPRKRERVERRIEYLDDLCLEAPGGFRPWEWNQAPYDSAPLTYLRVHRALVFVRSGLVMPRPWRVVLEARPDWRYVIRPLPGTIEEVDGIPTLSLGKTKPGRIIAGPALSLCHVHGGNYGHWFCDNLSALIDLLPPVLQGRLQLLVPTLWPWQRRSLELLGVPSSAVVEINKPIVGGDDLICHSYNWRNHLAHSGPVLAEVFQRIRAGKINGAGNTGRPAMIYVSRSKIKAPRVLAEESEVEAALARLGFVTVRPESMTLDEQIVTFSRARVVVGPHGSGLANAGFAPPGCLIVEILPSQMTDSQLLPAIARHLGHRVIVLVAKQELSADPSMDKGTPHTHYLLGRYSIKPELVVERVLAGMERLGIARA
jgi:hypothetical protein